MFIDRLNVLADWCNHGVRVVSVTQQLDFNGTVGKILAAIFFALGEMEQQTRKGTASGWNRCSEVRGQIPWPSATQARLGR